MTDRIWRWIELVWVLLACSTGFMVLEHPGAGIGAGLLVAGLLKTLDRR